MTQFFRPSPLCVRAEVIDSKGDPVGVDIGEGRGVAFVITRRETAEEGFEDNEAEFGERIVARTSPEFDIAESAAIKIPHDGKTYRIAGRRAGGALEGRMSRLNYVDFILRES